MKKQKVKSHLFNAEIHSGWWLGIGAQKSFSKREHLKQTAHETMA